MLHFGSMFILGLWGSSKKIIGPFRSHLFGVRSI
jgi:hypothetical protein